MRVTRRRWSLATALFVALACSDGAREGGTIPLGGAVRAKVLLTDAPFP